MAVRTGIYYFVEVKYRSSVHQGGGFAAITPKKLRQMNFAAEVYASRHPNTQLTLMAAAVDARGVVELIEIT